MSFFFFLFKLKQILFNAVFHLQFFIHFRALRRVTKGSAQNLQEAYRCTHPGSRNPSTLEHSLHRLVSILANEFLQWELTSSLPCKLLLAIIAKRLQVILETVSCPNWIFENLFVALHSKEDNITPVDSTKEVHNLHLVALNSFP